MFREIMPSYRLFSDLNVKDSEFRKLFGELRLYWAGLESEANLCREIESIGSQNHPA